MKPLFPNHHPCDHRMLITRDIVKFTESLWPTSGCMQQRMSGRETAAAIKRQSGCCYEHRRHTEGSCE